MKDADTPPQQRVSNMTFAELATFFHNQQGRVETAWFRITYLHAAMVGVLVFFGEAEDFLLFQRAVVFAFYTINLLIFYLALRDGYDGMQAAQKDLGAFTPGSGVVEGWFRGRSFAFRSGLRALALVVAWLVILYLLFHSVTLA